MTAIYRNTQYILYVYTFMSVLCTALYNNVYVFHMVLRTAIYNYRLHCGRNKNHFYKMCDSVIYISFL